MKAKVSASVHKMYAVAALTKQYKSPVHQGVHHGTWPAYHPISFIREPVPSVHLSHIRQRNRF
jgi:hypothetical protein